MKKTKTPPLRLWAYRKFQSWVVEACVLPRVMSERRISEEKIRGILSQRVPPRVSGVERAWFHAASVGELESLTPVILEWAARGQECVVTVLSESAQGSIERLRKSLASLPGRALYLGYSPWEGRWEQALRAVNPSIFLTAKYEAWPELWSALAARKISLLIVSAKARRSLRIAGGLCRALGGKIPQIRLLTVRKADEQELKKALPGPEARVIRTGEPRWDRVAARSGEGNPRARALIDQFASHSRPWGVLGQVWPEDMELWRGRYAKGAGTLWVAPHRVDAPSVAAVEVFLIQAGLRVGRTSDQAKLQSLLESRLIDCVLIDEVGFLLELYSAADWAYVGGGFGISMHSTIEPALFGIPVSCGPHGADKFPEIAELRETGQLGVIRHADELDLWLNSAVAASRNPAQRSEWAEQAKSRLGATQRILQVMADELAEASAANTA
jgi:3-deoxy-D-manno-octulosonic-acid transferase